MRRPKPRGEHVMSTNNQVPTVLRDVFDTGNVHEAWSRALAMMPGTGRDGKPNHRGRPYIPDGVNGQPTRRDQRRGAGMAKTVAWTEAIKADWGRHLPDLSKFGYALD